MRPFGEWAFIKRAVIEIGIFSAITNVLLLTSPLFMLQMYDRVLPSESMSTLIYLSIIAAAALAVWGALEIVRTYYANRVASKIDARLGGDAFLASMAGPRSAHGDVQPLQDLGAVRGFIGSKSIFFLFDLPFTPLFMALVYLIHPMLFWLTLGGVVLMIGLALLNQYATRKDSAKAAETLSGSMGLAQAFVRNQETIRALGMMSNVTETWGRKFADSLQTADKAAGQNAVYAGISRFIRMGLQVAILGVGAYFVLQQEMTAGMIFASSLIAGRALQPLDQIIGGWRQIVAAGRAWKRLRAMNAAGIGAPTETIELPEAKGALSAEQLVYFIPESDPGNPLIKRLSFQIAAGESVAIIGPSRAGKSTLARLIVGALRPSSGTVRVDGADIRTFDSEVLGRQIGYVPQEVDLFPGTVAENIARFEPDASDEDVVTAAQRAKVHDLVLNMKKGYLTEIGAGGARLSGGERQRVSLARAFYGNPKLLVLDEPNSNLDTEGEQSLERAIAEAHERGTTVLLITHKPALAARCDRIMVMREGQIEMMGPARDVLKKLMQATTQAQQPPRPAPEETQPDEPPPTTPAATATMQPFQRVKAV